jgi:hypothetical protein
MFQAEDSCASGVAVFGDNTMPNTQTILMIIFCLVDDLVNRHARVKPGARAKFSDSELIALVLYKELAGIESEYQLLRLIRRDYLDLFPKLIGQSQFNRRARSLCWLIEKIRQHVLGELNASWPDFAIIDSTSVPMKHAVRAARTRSEKSQLIGFGRRFVHKEDYYGMKLHLLVNRYGVPTTATVTRPSVADCVVVSQMLENRANLIVLGDKAYSGKPLREQLLREQSILLIAPAKAYPGHKNTASERHALRKGRLLIESVINMLKNHLQLGRILARTELGLLARIQRKLTAFVTAIYINLQLGRPCLAVKSLVA